jgi:hypothetical protein
MLIFFVLREGRRKFEKPICALGVVHVSDPSLLFDLVLRRGEWKIVWLNATVPSFAAKIEIPV